MSFQVFVAYSHREDQVLALRLQTLASTRPGLTVFVPPASTRSRAANVSDAGSDWGHLKNADLLLALIRGTVPPRMEQELQYASGLGKPVIPITVGDTAQQHSIQGYSWFHLDPTDPTSTEQRIMAYLDSLKVGKDSREAVGALILLTLGLMVLGSK
jgi:hypothetical protein